MPTRDFWITIALFCLCLSVLFESLLDCLRERPCDNPWVAVGRIGPTTAGMPFCAPNGMLQTLLRECCSIVPIVVRSTPPLVWMSMVLPQLNGNGRLTSISWGTQRNRRPHIGVARVRTHHLQPSILVSSVLLIVRSSQVGVADHHNLHPIRGGK